MTLGGVVAFSVGHGGGVASVAAAAGAAALVLLAAGLVLQVPQTIPWAIAAAGAGYLVTRVGHAAVDGWAALVGAALLLAAELAFWSAMDDTRIRVERALVAARVATIAALVATTLLVDFLLLGTAAVSGSSSVVLAGAGVAAAVAAVAVVLRLLRD